MSYTIRDANHSDILELVICCKQFSKEIGHTFAKMDPTKVTSLIQQLIEGELGFAKVVEYEGEIVGCMGAYASELMISNLFVSQEILLWFDPDHRNGKMAFKLIDEYVKWSKDVGCIFARLSAQNLLEDGRAGVLYKRKGFQALETAYLKEL